MRRGTLTAAVLGSFMTLTYANEASSFGSCGARVDGTCPRGWYCDTPVGLCDLPKNTASCIKAPKFCTKEYKPVCGCDSRTYPNKCAALSAGVGIKEENPCPELPGSGVEPGREGAVSVSYSCGGPIGAICPDGYLCMYGSDNACGVYGQPGKCIKLDEPVMCAEIYDPVCGCDGETYENACTAFYQRKVNVQHRGACPELIDPMPEANITFSCGGLMGNACPKGYFCVYDESCGAADMPGTCMRPPTVCEVDIDGGEEVCGCDDRTYATACLANAAGVSIRAAGPCKAVPPASSSTEGITMCDNNESACPTGTFCKFATGTCGLLVSPLTQGVCTKHPSVCEQLMQPVCGCDGHTYSNECMASMAGASVREVGGCPVIHHLRSPGHV